jgi:hypothetical protein
MACNVERAVDPRDFTRIPRTRELIKELPEQTRTCSQCGREVTISPERGFSVNPGGSAPFTEVSFLGCDESINRVKAVVNFE